MKTILIARLLAALIATVVTVRLFYVNAREAARAKPPAPGVIPRNSIFHKNPTAACPQGTELLPGYFSEKDGSKLDACYDPHGDGSIDYLSPGESCEIPFRFRKETDNASRAK
jgi:hypothetical protein